MHKIFKYCFDISFFPISPKKYIILISIFCLCFIFFIHHFLSEYREPLLTGDTPGYFVGSISKPWSFVYTPGLRIYAKILGIDYNNYRQLTNAQLNDIFRIMVYSNVILYALSISLLISTLSTFIPPVYLVVLIPYFSSGSFIIAPNLIGSDPPSLILCLIFTSMCCIYFKTKRHIALFTSCIIATLACQFKPLCIFLPTIAGIICICEFITTKKMLKPLMMIFLLLCGTLLWPVWLYMNSGYFFYSQLSIRHELIDIIYFLMPGDENLFEKDIDKKFVRSLIEAKHENRTEEKPYSSTLEKYINTCNKYAFRTQIKVIRNMFSERVFRNRFDLYDSLKRIKPKIIWKYKHQRIQLFYQSVMRAFLPQASPFSGFLDRSLKYHFLGKFWPILFFASILIAIYACHKRKFCNTMPIYVMIFSSQIHLLNIIAMSIGHASYKRYLQMTEWSFLLATLVSLYVIVHSVSSSINYNE